MATDAPQLADILPMSFAQQRLWFLDQLEPNSPLYNVPTVLRVTGKLNEAALQSALEAIVARHEVLRTRFVSIEGNPAQIPEENVSLKLAVRDLSDMPAARREVEAGALVRAEANLPFELSSAPLLRTTLLRLQLNEHWFLVTFHHMVSDEWSLKIFFKELAELYEANCNGAPANLPALPIQYADYAVWQRDWFKGEVFEEQLRYWRKSLSGNPPLLELPADRPRPAVPAFRGGNQARALPKGLGQALKQIAERNHATLFMVLLAAFKALLHRYTQQDDIVVASPIAGRSRVETEPLVGFFVNTLALRTDASGNPTFEELLGRVREVMLGAYAHPDLPFDKLVEHLQPERSLDHLPFTRIMFSLQNEPPGDLRWPGLTLEFLDTETDTAKFDWTFAVRERAGELSVRVEYNRDLFESGAIARVLGHFENLLKSVVADPKLRISELTLLSSDERRQLLAEWSAVESEYPRKKCVQEIFEDQVERNPGAIAVAYGPESLTYRELNARANQLAARLRRLSVAPDVLVGLCVERSVEMIVGMLAILKAGGAYVPLDPTYPKERLEFMLQDSRTPVLLTQQHLLKRLPRSSAKTICLDSEWRMVAKEGAGNPPLVTRPENLAYVIYTSGSTGRPKGAAVPHRAVNRLVLNTNYIQFSAQDCIAQVANASFDAATFEIWGALLNGGKLVGFSREMVLSPKDFAREIRDQRISAMFLTAALFNQLACELPGVFSSVRTVMVGGEALDPKWIRAVLSHDPPRRLLNGYGPTENTTFSCWHEIRYVPEEATSIPIGRPVANSECYVLDPNLNLLPIGVPGELHVGGDGLARGYWNRPELTATKFIPNPFGGARHSRFLYKTGDLVRWRADGNIEFLGRADHQIKIRGFRVELEEIETVLNCHPGVRGCIVTAHRNGSGPKLAAYFAPNGKRAPSPSELRAFLMERLPEYMVPPAFVRLDQLPLTPNGKLDRQALPEPGKARAEPGKKLIMPRDAVEVGLTQIWEDILGVRPIGIEDRFFELGGHSLLAVRLVARIEKAFARKLRLAAIFQAPTIEQLAAIIRSKLHEGAPLAGTSLVEIQTKGTRPPLYFVHGAGGGMFWGYVNLSRHLGTDQPVYGLKSRGMDGRDELGTVEEMAAQYAADIRVLQPHGPYYLGGYCFGGNVAYEIACRLEAQGEEVALLALLNCAPPNSNYAKILWTPAWGLRFARNLCYWANCFLHWTRRQRRDFLRWKLERWKHRLTHVCAKLPRDLSKIAPSDVVDLSSFPPEQRKLWEAHVLAQLKYHPKPYSGRARLFRSPGHLFLCSFADDYGWGEWVKDGVSIHVVPGAHEKILEEPCVQVVAAEMKKALGEIAAQRAAPAPGGRALAQSGETERSDTRTNLPLGKTCVEHFQARARETPNAIALTCGAEHLTYRQLNERANQLAHHLRTLGVGPETPVALYLDRSLNLLVAILGVLKAGGAYVPMDLAYPIDRLSFMLEDARAPVLITQENLRASLPSRDLKIICLDSEWNNISARATDNPINETTRENAAYIIYTSGSTGKPKGVIVTHHNVVRLLRQTEHWYQFNSSDVWSLFHSCAFDVSVFEMWGALFYGGRLVVVPYFVSRTPKAFYELLSQEQVTVLSQTPSAFRQLIRADASAPKPLPLKLRYVICAGEALELQSLKPWFDRHGDRQPQVVNMYGITETTVHSTFRVIRNADLTSGVGSVIGVPIPDLQIHLLDENLQRVPMGAPGEICVGGAGVARGYLNRPELTAQRFVPDPFSNMPGAKLYRSGDLAQINATGEMEYLGRMDHQVKIRGFRVELGEIESALNRHPGIRESVVVERDAKGGTKRLVAYAVPVKGTPTISELREWLGQSLPEYMIPAIFIFLDSLPLTINGKVDRQALPSPAGARPKLQEEFAAPRNATEQLLADIWEDVLEMDKVGVNDNYFELGGDSIRSIVILSRAQQSGLNLSLQQMFQHPTVAALAACVEVPGQQAELQQTGAFSLISSEDRAKLPADAEDAYPLTRLQLGMFFHNELDPVSAIYHDVFSFRVQSELDRGKLEQALNRLVARHPVLRTSFHLAGFSETLQVVHRNARVPLTVEGLRGVDSTEQSNRLVAWVNAEKRNSFDRAVAPLVRFHVQLHGETSFQLIISFHHVCLDGWSLAAVITELLQEYAALRHGTDAHITAPRIGYREFIALEKQSLASEETRRFWTERLSNANLQLLPRWPEVMCAGGHEQSRSPEIFIEPKVLQGLKQLAQTAGVPLKTVLLAAHLRVMSLLHGQADVTTGLLCNGRPEAVDGEKVVGLFLNTLPIRQQLNGGTWLELTKQTFASEREILPHRRLPLAEIQKLMAGQHLFEAAFDFVHFHVYRNLQECQGLDFEEGHYFEANNLTAFTTFMLDVTSTRLQMHIDYDPNTICRKQAEETSAYYINTLRSMAFDPNARYETFSPLSEAETKRTSAEWNARAEEYPRNRCLHQLFEARAAETPDVVALVFENKALTFRELNCRANRVARRLRGLSVGPDVMVGICVERSIEMVVGLLGILKAGGAYVPLDPGFPKARLEQMVADAQMPVLLTQEHLVPHLPASGAKVVLVQPVADGAGLDENLSNSISSENLAYVIYTSGSTGKPKAVQVPHRAVVNLLVSAARTAGVTAKDNLLAVTTISFDIAALELWLPLILGGKLTLASHEAAADGTQLAALIESSGATLVQATPARWRLLIEAGWKGNKNLKIFCGGEALKPGLADDLLKRAKEVWNFYGPTETTVWSTAWQVATGERISIGRPLANTQVYILGPHLQPLPVGAIGELHIGGDGLSRGYLNWPELTAEKFIPNPFSDDANSRLYKTGDLARYLPDGRIECLGRIDHQVKIRGFRIELGDVEAVLRRHPGITDVLVTAREDALGEQRLVGYVVSKNGPLSLAELRDFMKAKLPAYMVPARFVALKEFPVTPNGKIDLRRLPAPETNSETAPSYVASQTEAEHCLAEIFQEVLMVNQVGVTDNFFDLGCDSLSATRAFARINKAFAVQITLRDVFEHPTIRSLADVVSQSRGASVPLRQEIPRRPRVSQLPCKSGFIATGP